MSSNAPLLVLGLAAAAFFAFPQISGAAAPASAPPEPEPDPRELEAPRERGTGTFADDVVGGLWSGLGNIFSGVGAGLGTALGNALGAADLNDPQSQARRGTRKLGDTFQEAGAALGFTSSPSKKRKKKRQAEKALNAQLYAMERFAARVHTELSHPDVREWVLSSAGEGGNAVFDVYYRGTDTPRRIPVPAEASINRVAWAAEPVYRALGVFIQRGKRFATPFVRHNPPAYSDRNTHAPSGETVTAIGAMVQRAETRTLERLGRTLSSKSNQRALEFLGGQEAGEAGEE